VHHLLRRAAEEWLFGVSLLGLIASSLVLRRIPRYTPDDFHVLFLLLGFLVIIRGLEKGHLLARLGASLGAGGRLPLRLVALTALLAPLVTNDVALLVMVPLTLAADVEGVEGVIALETVVANGASALTPFGNPQNLFIYYHFDLRAGEFVGAIFPLALAATGFAVFLAGRMKARSRALPPPPVDRGSYPYVVLLALFLPVALKLLPLWAGVAPLLYAAVRDREALRVDYFLLLTFLCFFGFTDNLLHAFSPRLKGPGEVFLYTALSSQLISNVPSTLLFADFTSNWRALLWGASVGGFGTLFGSLASLISYRLFARKNVGKWRFLAVYHLYSFAALGIGVAAFFLLRPGG